MNIQNRKYDDEPESDFTWIVITLLLLIAFTIVYADELWAFMDWVMTVEENFNGRHQ